MGDSENVATLVDAVNEGLTDPARNRVVGSQKGDGARFELYHAGLSICSQKVRTVLAEKSLPYTSHEMSILNRRGIYTEELTPAENYAPAYVRLRLYGGEQAGLAFANSHTGRSSVETEGFDACVVPTLVDHEKSAVIVDSKRICEYLDQECPGESPLIPTDSTLATAVMEQVSIVDTTPQPGLLYGFHPDDDRRPEFIKNAMTGVYDNKVEALEMLIEANKDDDRLLVAYRSKIAKEQQGKVIAHETKSQYAIRAEVEGIISGLDMQLEAQTAPWICGSEFSLADLTWGVNLYRMHWLGLASLWANMPQVKEYTTRLYQRPSIWKNVIKFPSAMPESPHTADIKGPKGQRLDRGN